MLQLAWFPDDAYLSFKDVQIFLADIDHLN